MIPLLGKAVGGLLVVEGSFRQISLMGIGLTQVILQHRSQNRIAAERQSPVVCIYGKTWQARPAADIAQSLDLINILELQRKFAADILVDSALSGAFQQFAYQFRTTSFDGLAIDFL